MSTEQHATPPALVVVPDDESLAPVETEDGSAPDYVPEPGLVAAIEAVDNRFVDRELSWLRFNERVLELAEDETIPLLERANFLAIFAANLDEFFMVRVAGLKRRIVTGLAVPTNVGRAPTEVLAEITPRLCSPAALAALPSGACCVLPMPELRPESSSQLRRRIEAGDPGWPEWVPPVVADYILEQGLYGVSAGILAEAPSSARP